jgi:hypothetical protein
MHQKQNFGATALYSKCNFGNALMGTMIALDIISMLNGIQDLLIRIGPILSAILFICAGIFYAVGQFMPSYKRASLHTMAIDMIIGAVVVAVLSVGSTTLAEASMHLISNQTANATVV